MTPVQMVARELAKDQGGEGALTEEEYDRAFRGIFQLLHDRSMEALISGISNGDALTRAAQYCAYGEAINAFGTALIAFADIDSQRSSATTN